MNPEKLSKSIYLWARWYFLVCLLPAILLTFGIMGSLLYEHGQVMTVQKLDCYSEENPFSCSPPVNVTMYGQTFTPRIVGADEYEHITNKYASYELRSLAAILIGVVFLILNALHKRGKL